MKAPADQRIPHAPGKAGVSDYIRALRPEHWIKNTVVLAAFFFALGDASEIQHLHPFSSSIPRALAAAVLFCVISSGIYVFNDICDVALDRAHPVKRKRPIAAGSISLLQARIMAIILLSAGIGGSILLSPVLGAVVTAYVAVQALYSFAFKKIALLDVIVISGGFVLRALAGAVVLSVSISHWLILCTFLLALFLGFCKRRHEKIMLSEEAAENRPSLVNYDERLLDQVIAIVASATVVSYSLYTLSPDTIEKFGTAALAFSIPFVMFGIFRYLDLVYRHEKGNRPERILLTDVPLLIDVALYAATVLGIVLVSRWLG